MKTSILATTLALSLFTTAGFAAGLKPTEQRVLETLIKNSGQLTLVGDDDRALDAEMQLPSLIAKHLTGGYLSAKEKGSSIVLGDVSIDCRSGPGAHGADQFDCSVTFIDGDFEVTDRGLEGPELESSLSFEVSLVKESKGQLRILAKRLKAFLAG